MERAARLLRSARRAVALTGAGISTPSGIPDFRSPGTGLWEHYDPMAVASLSAFRYDPEGFYRWIHPLADTILRAEPNAAHVALSRLERAGRLTGVVTQNIDDLHRRAGSQHVLEIHGHLRQATCVACYRVFPTDSFIHEYQETQAIPRCPECGGILKPNVVLYEEQLPVEIVREAEAWIAACDVLLVVGSSLEVTPAATFPLAALEAGAHLIIINRDPTYLDPRADVLFHQDAAEVLPCLVDEVLRERQT